VALDIVRTAAGVVVSENGIHRERCGGIEDIVDAEGNGRISQ
jgi:hypothetical protein